MNGVQYYGLFLMKGSAAYELWDEMKRDPSVKNKLDALIKEVGKKYEPLPDWLVDFKIGTSIKPV